MRYARGMTHVESNPSPVRDYTLPEACPICEADLPVRVTPAGANAVCNRCSWWGKPVLTVTKGGLEISFPQAEA